MTLKNFMFALTATRPIINLWICRSFVVRTFVLREKWIVICHLHLVAFHLKLKFAISCNDKKSRNSSSLK